MPAAITIELRKAVQKSASSKMNAYASKPKRYDGLKKGALRKLCQKISPSGRKITAAVIATTVVRGRLKVRAVIFFPASFAIAGFAAVVACRPGAGRGPSSYRQRNPIMKLDPGLSLPRRRPGQGRRNRVRSL